jgi:sulfur transfer complex TusBCD TusB component (DsrH family)
MNVPDTYLGDGVYASYDGYHIVLAVNHHNNKVISLDDDVMEKLIKYHNEINKTINQNKNNYGN